MKVWVSALNMAPTLRAPRRTRFSETALLEAMVGRSHPGHHDARRHIARGAGAGAPGAPVGARRHTEDAPEGAAERPQARETDVEADLRHRPVGLTQQGHRTLEPPPLQVAVRRLAERLPEGPDEMRLRHQRHARQRADIE